VFLAFGDLIIESMGKHKLVLADQNRTEQNRTEQNRTEQNTEQNRPEQNRTEHTRTEQNKKKTRVVMVFILLCMFYLKFI